MIEELSKELKKHGYDIKECQLLSPNYLEILKSIGKSPTIYYKIYNIETEEEILEIAKMEFIKGYKKEYVYQLLHLKNERIRNINYTEESKRDIIKDALNFISKDKEKLAMAK